MHRTQTQMLKQQQDQAYFESLQIDREKERRIQELEEKSRIEREIERQKEEEERAIKLVSIILFSYKLF